MSVLMSYEEEDSQARACQRLQNKKALIRKTLQKALSGTCTHFHMSPPCLPQGGRGFICIMML